MKRKWDITFKDGSHIVVETTTRTCIQRELRQAVFAAVKEAVHNPINITDWELIETKNALSRIN